MQPKPPDDHFASLLLAYQLGKIETSLKRNERRLEEILAEIRTLVSAKPAPAQHWLKEFGLTVLRGLIPHLTPYVLALIGLLGAAAIAGWKAFSRGWLI